MAATAAFASQRRLVGLAPVAAVATASVSYAYMAGTTLRLEDHDNQRKLPIYSAPPEPVVLAEVRGPLEEQVAAARRSLLDTTRGARSAVQGQVDRWIGVEKAVENRVSSLIPDDEPITPGMLYVGIATLAGSVFTRYRSLPIRLVAPPLLFVGSLNYFLPSTAYNVGQYYLELEQRHLPPVVREQRQNVLQSWHNVRRSTGQQLAKAREGTGDLLQRGLQGVEQNTGLKVGGGGNGKASSNAEPRSRLV